LGPVFGTLSLVAERVIWERLFFMVTAKALSE